MRKIVFCLLIISSVFIQCTENKTWLLKNLEKQMKRYNPPSIAAAIINLDGIMEIETIGVKKLGENNLVSINDQYHIGSVTKSFTALLASKLVSEGFIKWNTKIVDIYPEFNKIHIVYKKVTFSDLLNHKGKIPSFMYKNDWNNLPIFDGNIIEKRYNFAKWVLENKEPLNTNFQYSNAGYTIAGSMMEKVTGQDWEYLVTEYIFNQYNLKSASFKNPAYYDSSKVWGHWQQWVGKTPTVPVNPITSNLNEIDAPSGDIHMSIQDLANYALIHLKDLNGIGKNSEFMKLVHESENQYSFGWYRQSFEGENVSIHWGSNATFIAGIMICPRLNIAVVVASNSSDNDAKEACRKIFEDVLGIY